MLEMLKFSAIDIFLLLVIAFFAVKCALTGLVAEIMKKLAVVLGVVFAFAFRLRAAAMIFSAGITQNRILAVSLGALAVFVCVFLAVHILMQIIGAAINSVKILSSLDKTLGFFFGILEGFVVVIVILAILYMLSLSGGRDFCSDSFFFRLIFPKVTTEIREFVPPIVAPPIQVL